MDSVIKFFQIEISFKNTHNYNKNNLLLITNLQLIKEYVQPTKKLILENRQKFPQKMAVNFNKKKFNLCRVDK